MYNYTLAVRKVMSIQIHVKDKTKIYKSNPKAAPFKEKILPWVRSEALLTELPRQLSWLSSNLLYKSTQDNKFLNLINW